MKMGELNVEIEICCRAEFITYACEILRKSVKVFCRFLNFFTERGEKRVSHAFERRSNGVNGPAWNGIPPITDTYSLLFPIMAITKFHLLRLRFTYPLKSVFCL